ncbi:MAG TPA: UDP-N-acetylmuramoyl-L-alanyl-D-glutamate--2,6-diaminopimelate ligase [Bacilli bacterium]|nr:UDP-N-acetylmuramoyl-L-alanyl-D-glutamate--2,6-diaminopimelate ligase [Bacilli bacterium]
MRKRFNIITNSKDVKKNDIFVCNNKNIEERDKYIEDAINNGAKKIICEDTMVESSIPIIKVDNVDDELLKIVLNYYDVNLDDINLIGITGTDGKTTVANLVKDLLSNFIKTSYLGTIGFKIDNTSTTTKNTTPKLENIIKFIKKSIGKKCKVMAMEVSSEGLFYDRCHGLQFDIGILTNITKDHLNTHKTMKNYKQTKAKLFKQIKSSGWAILNRDDKFYKFIKQSCNSNIITYGKNKNCDFYISNIKSFTDHTTFNLKYKKNIYKISSPLLAIYNVYNLVAAIAAICCFDIDINEVLKYISTIKPIAGRLSSIKCGQNYDIIVDYAHTINATKETLKYFSKIKKNRLITILGCAGGRDKTKRKYIGKLASKYSDLVIFTEDDPRDEEVIDIIYDMLENVNNDNYVIITSRKDAVNYALSNALKDDTILFLGKGNDSYMAKKEGYIYYQDEDEIKNYFKKNHLPSD